MGTSLGDFHEEQPWILKNMDCHEHNQWPPGFRFFPTDEELVVHYLCKKAASQIIHVPIIAEVDLYKYDPWKLPGISLFFVFPLRLILVYLNRF